uniref:Enolase-phosphatase 1 n=1 Tax=Salarias fasciatus TaxID=181472 RepID=A0A672I3M4_SALFA
MASVCIPACTRALLLDIEGTTTPITFVKDVLFPYIREHLEDHLSSHWEEDECKQDVHLLKKQIEEDMRQNRACPMHAVDQTVHTDEEKAIREVVENVLWQMAADRNVHGAQAAAGSHVEGGVLFRRIKGELYQDVVFIYSSGSVEAQKLLFGYSVDGDVCSTGHFDTNVGAKVESKSYESIAERIGVPPEEITFLTDVSREAKAAEEAGLNVVLVVRPGNLELTEEERSHYSLVTSFSQLQLSG